MTVRLIPTPLFDAGSTHRESPDESTHRIDTVDRSGSHLWGARQVATALGYARDNAVVDAIGSDIRRSGGYAAPDPRSLRSTNAAARLLTRLGWLRVRRAGGRGPRAWLYRAPSSGPQLRLVR
jgi:hypothetical protein